MYIPIVKEDIRSLNQYLRENYSMVMDWVPYLWGVDEGMSSEERDREEWLYIEFKSTPGKTRRFPKLYFWPEKTREEIESTILENAPKFKEMIYNDNYFKSSEQEWNAK